MNKASSGTNSASGHNFHAAHYPDIFLVRLMPAVSMAMSEPHAFYIARRFALQHIQHI
jgi:hypothetical protein